jgi:hypothetical protein
MAKKEDIKVEHVDIETLIPYARNAKLHSETQVAAIAGSIREFGFCNPVLIDKDGGIIAGHGRVLAARKLELKRVPCIRLGHLTDNQKRAYIIADNRLAETGGGWLEEMLQAEVAEIDWSEIKGIGIDDFEFDTMAFAEIEPEPESTADAEPSKSLADRFGVPPFSVLNAREGVWQDRKRAWLALGIKSELGRGEQLIPNGGGMGSKSKYTAAPGGGAASGM